MILEVVDRMAEILPFKRRRLSEKHRGNTLCRNGHHKWEVDRESVFDSQQGRLVTRYVCRRCGKSRTRAL
jgi:hypothetical protein